jgi:hypothetical protein
MAAERLTSTKEDSHPRICPFEVGKAYTKEDIYRIFEVSAARRGGNWNTGYTKYDGYWFIFSNIGTPGRTGHDYGDQLANGQLSWFGKTKSHIGQDSIVDMVSETSVVFVFYRRESRSPYTFAGVGKAREIRDRRPVEIEWEIIAVPYRPLPLLLLPTTDSAPVTANPPKNVVEQPTRDIPKWVQQLVVQPIFQQATLHAGRHRPSDAVLAQLLAELDAAQGRQLPLPRVAKALGCPEVRIGGLIAQASRILNRDGYLVLSLTGDRGFVRLDRELAMRQFLTGYDS